MLALAGGGISAMKMAGPLHPPFSLFLLEEKEKTGRARSKREKEGSPLRGDVGRGDALGVPPFFMHVFYPRRSASGGFGGWRMDLLLFSLPLTWYMTIDDRKRPKGFYPSVVLLR
jgi:hypothetical protein